MAPSRVADPVAWLLGSLREGRTADVRTTASRWTTIRFAGGRVHQPHTESLTRVSLRVEDDRRLGVATTNDLSGPGLERLLRTATALAAVAPRERAFPGFPSPDGRVPNVAYSEATAGADLDDAVTAAERLISSALGAAPGAQVAGALHVGGDRLRVANTSGLDREARVSGAQTTVLAERPDADPPRSGWSEGASWALERLDLDGIGAEAGARMPVAAPRPIAAGTYPVVLRGSAVSEAFAFLGNLGFGGNAEVDGSSCLRTWRGRRLGPTSLTVVDDPRSDRGLPRAIDYEGLAAGPFPLLTRGRVGRSVADLVTAGRLRRRPTGHAFPPEAPWGAWGAFPSHMVVAPGSESEEELLRRVRRGILVTRFHYVRTVDPASGTITGMTRDGTYRIEDGELGAPVRNLRFTESVRTMVAGVTGVGSDTRVYSDERAQVGYTVPPLAVRAFRFTSATVF